MSRRKSGDTNIIQLAAVAVLPVGNEKKVYVPEEVRVERFVRHGSAFRVSEWRLEQGAYRERPEPR